MPASPNRDIVHISVLGIISLATLFFAIVNTLVQQIPTFSMAIGVIVGAILSQIPGLIVGLYSTKQSSLSITILLIPAYFIAVTGLLAYFVYAISGKADSLNSAAHMHVTFFPMLHCIGAVALYVFFAAVCGIIQLVRTNR